MKQWQSRSIKGAFHKVRNHVLKAEQMAMNKTVVSTRGKVIDFIRKVYNLKKKDLTSVSRIVKMGRKDTSVKILFSEKPIGLVKFGGKWRASVGRGKNRTRSSGATAEVKKGQRKTFDGTFIATMRSGHKGIWKRKAGTKTSGGKEKLKQYWGASGGQLFNSSKARKFMSAYFFRELQKQVNVAIRALSRK